MSFMHQEVKYRGMEPVLGFKSSQAQPRPGLIEANNAVKRLLSRPKQSRVSVISCSPDGGLQCVDTTFNPPEVILNNTVYEIAHCGVDVVKPKLFTVIVGKKETQDFFCHVFKCASKDQATKFVRAVASACTLAYQNYQKAKKQQQQQQPQQQQQQQQQPSRRQGPPASSMRRPPQADRRSQQIRSSMRRPQGASRQQVRNGKPNPKLTDSWFRPSMTRGEVNTILRAGRIGDFIVRESQTRPGDYAIAVQTGNQIWTGLLVHGPSGFQLGERGGITFPEITELVAHYAQNTFMNDANQHPMALRVPDDTAWMEEAATAATFSRTSPSTRGVPDWRDRQQQQQTTTAPQEQEQEFSPLAALAQAQEDDLTFEQIMNGEFNPEQEWPQSSGDEEDNNVEFIPGGIPDNDKDAFEMFMNQGGFDVDENGELVPLDTVAKALDEIDQEGHDYEDEDEDDDDFVPGEMPSSTSAADGGFGDDFDPTAAATSTSSGFGDDFEASITVKNTTTTIQTNGGGFDDDFTPSSAPTHGFEDDFVGGATQSPVEVLAQQIFEMHMDSADEDDCIQGGDIRPTLMASNLPVETLGTIWMDVDSDRRGKLDVSQIALVLGLMAQAQMGQEPSLETLDLQTIDPPTMNF